MGRIEDVFRERKSPAFIGFTVAGDPCQKTRIRIAKALIAGGTDILELGVPFSDPVADGPTIQRADERALSSGTTTDARIQKIVKQAEGYLSLVAVLGVTGVRKTVSSDAIDLLRRVRMHTDLPLALGFGISSPEHARACAAGGADGVIVGSAIVNIVEQHLEDLPAMERELRGYVSRMKEGAGSI